MNEDVMSTAPVEATTPEIAPNVIPPEPVEATEEPVMIAANIDEMSQDELAAIAPTTEVETTQPEAAPVETPQPETTPQEETPVEVPATPETEVVPVADPVVEVPAAAPDLGNPENESKEETVPTFQQMPEEEQQPETETPAVADPAPSNEQITVPLPDSTSLTDMYQAKPAGEAVPTFQQMPEAPTTPVEVVPTADSAPVDLDEEDEDKQKKGIPKIVPLIIIGIVLIAVVAVGIMVIRSKGNGSSVKTLRPDRSADSSTNIAILGHVDTPKADVVVSITKLIGVNISKEEVESCKEDENHGMKFGIHYIDMNINGSEYSINYPCGFSSAIKYLVVSEGDKTVDGAILIVSASEGIMPQTREYIITLSKLGINKIVVYIIADGDTAKTEEDVKALLGQYR